jgi:hypothetical protein
MATIVNHLKVDPDLKQVLHDLATDLADVRTKYAALLADVASARAKYNLTLAKLDLDAGVTDTNYAATNPIPAATATALATAQFSKA